MKKKLSILFVIIGLLVSFSVSMIQGEEVVKITFWDENPGPNRTPYYEELIRRFEAENPNIKVEYVGIPWDSAKDKFSVAVISGETPDVAGMPDSFLSEFILRGAFLPLDDYFNVWEDKDKFIEANINSLRAVAPDKKLYHLPISAQAYNLWYRVDHFEEAGLPSPESENWSWDDFFASVKALRNEEKGRYGFSIRGGSGSDQQLLSAMLSYSGLDRLFDEEGNCLLNHPLHVEFLERYVDLYKSGYTPQSDITNGYQEMVAAFGSGVVSMIQHNIGSLDEHRKNLEEGQYAAAPMPRSVNGNRSDLAGGINGFVIFSGTKHPKEAWKFISFLCSYDSQSYWNRQIGQMPTRSDLLAEDWVQNAQHISVVLKAMAEPGSNSVPKPLHLPEYLDSRTQIAQPGFQEVLAGEKTPKEFLDEWANAWFESQKNYQKMLENLR